MDIAALVVAIINTIAVVYAVLQGRKPRSPKGRHSM